jgi:response regulator RpfG family c-di-GMP phosphodiesterase
MDPKVLFVDDETNVLEAVRRQLRNKWPVDTAPGGEEALKMLEEAEPYAIIVSDMHMPHMNGIQFLAKARLLSPNSVRMMLTGNSDQQTAIEAVNEGHIFRFLNKPCPPDTLMNALTAGMQQYQLITAEKELLEKTLIGSIGVVMGMMSTANPRAFGRAQKLRKYAREIGGILSLETLWPLELAAMLSQIGQLMLPAELAFKVQSGTSLTKEEQDVVARGAENGRGLVEKIPRLEAVAQIIQFQHVRFDEAICLAGKVAPEEIPVEARIMKLVLDLTELEEGGMTLLLALRSLRYRYGWYDPQVLDAFAVYCQSDPAAAEGVPTGQAEKAAVARAIERAALPDTPGSRTAPGIPMILNGLCVGHILAVDVCSNSGSLLIAAKTQLTQVDLEKLKAFAKTQGVKQPFYIKPPM